MKVAVGLRRVAAGKRTSGRRAAQIAIDLRFGWWLTSDRNEGGGERHRGMTSGQHGPKFPSKNEKASEWHKATQTHEMT